MNELTFNSLKKQAETITDRDAFKTINISLLGDASTQFYKQALFNQGVCSGFNFNLFEADYDQIDLQVFDPQSELNEAKSDIVIVELTTKKLMSKFYELPFGNRADFAKTKLDYFRNIYQTLQANKPCKVIFHNFEEIDDQVFGNYANKTGLSFINQLRRINVGLADLSQELKDLYIVDTCALHSKWGREFAFSPKFHVMAAVPHSIDFTAIKAKYTTDIINALNGKFKKCLILDLDNTTWGGIIGDDGLDKIEIGDLGNGKAFTELQNWAKQLKERGVIIAVCSKNEEDIAKEPFEKHPDMVLKLEDIAVFVANWNNKADNIRYIQEVLNIGFDSMVFLDDNPAERAIVRENLTDVLVPELPADPAEYVTYLQGLNLFETISYSEADATRTKQYQEEAERKSLSQNYTNVEDFLKGLEMKSYVRHFEAFDIPRVAQLTQRSNQFNLRTVRYTDEDIKTIAESDTHVTFAFNLQDKFGEYGLISLIIMEKQDKALFIDTWIMSCRVLKRGMELFVLDNLATYARENGFTKLVGEYLPTPKNRMVADHYKELGFTENNGKWELDVNNINIAEYFITRI